MDHKINIKQEFGILETYSANERDLCSMGDDRSCASDTSTRNRCAVDQKIIVNGELDSPKRRKVLHMHTTIVKQEVNVLEAAFQNERLRFSKDFGKRLQNDTFIQGAGLELETNADSEECNSFEGVGLQNEENYFTSELVKKLKKEFITYNENGDVSIERMLPQTECKSQEAALYILEQSEVKVRKPEELKAAEPSRLTSAQISQDTSGACTSFINLNSGGQYQTDKVVSDTKTTNLYALGKSFNNKPSMIVYRFNNCNPSNACNNFKNFKCATKVVNGKRQHRCEICDKSFSCNAKLMLHSVVHSDERPYKCKTCGKTFKREADVKVHNRTHSAARPYKCKHCDASFKFSHGLSTHLQRHSSTKQYECDICKKRFSDKWGLQRHISSHSTTKQFKCDTCEKRFKTKLLLRMHTIGSHSDIKRYKCNSCDEKFGHYGQLTQHMVKHSGIKPHLCDKCGDTFISKTRLEHHLIKHSHQKPHLCDTCGKGFRREENLKQHVIKHSDKTSYFCDICGRGFKWKSNLKQHIPTHSNKKL